MGQRHILHCDCNCFYASVEMQEHPELRGKSIAVCGDPEARHGIVLTASYPAKRMGVKTGMPIWEAKQHCRDLIVVPASYGKYQKYSSYVREIFRDYTDQMESFGLDEAWLDITGSLGLFGDPVKIAKEISARIKRELGITVSIGVSFNKITAKLGSDYKGDPSSALLEVLDSAQNSSFRDHYIEVPFDLSHCMFITTANTTDTIPRALLDRMEVIELGSYTDEEKLQIAKRHLLPKQLKKHGMKRTQVRVSDDAIREIIACYTRESGVRSLERQIAALCRKCAMRFVSDEPPKRISITGGNLEDFLGVRKFLPEANVTTDQVGLVTGLAWTAVGGTTLEVEVNVVDGTGKLELTGNLGDVMKESAFAAMSFIRSRAKALGLAPDFYKTKDIHVHFPEGAVPKDGPSAGITICTAIVSALTNRPVRRDVAMTGEISIRGRVLAIGGLKEKTMAALRHGVKTVIIPAENEKDLEEIDQTVRQALQFITVSSADRVLEAALLPADDAAGTISVPAAPAMPIPAPKTRRKPGIRQ